MEQVLKIVIALLIPVVAAALAAAATAWGNAMIYAAQMIYQAYLNKELATGPEKMAWVVAQVKAYLPTIIRAIINDKSVQSACQSVYDAVKMYAVAYLDKNGKDGGGNGT
jgi:hypothetical protein